MATTRTDRANELLKKHTCWVSVAAIKAAGACPTIRPHLRKDGTPDRRYATTAELVELGNLLEAEGCKVWRG